VLPPASCADIFSPMTNTGRITQFFKTIYTKLVRINDTPQKIAVGFGIGVFLGTMPAVGPIVSLVLATVLRVNRAAALLGNLLTNAWLDIVTFLLAIKVGSFVIGVDWKDVHRNWTTFVRNHNWIDVFSLLRTDLLIPLFIGYFFIGLFLGVLSYLMTLVLVKGIRGKPAPQICNK